MRFRCVLLGALGGALVLSAGAPAYAQRDDHHRDFHAMRDHHDWRHHDRGYYAPPVVVAPPAYGYYAPPPVAPGISIGITIP
ncbi:MAG TPA: hypothetical protein VMB34_01860 [Acetobacteraceae bacterium]|nr:hypothetical protein [Acetobacteraceae bacterium]